MQVAAITGHKTLQMFPIHAFEGEDLAERMK
jgi:hypothetical protein